MATDYTTIEKSIFESQILKKLNRKEYQAKNYKGIIQNSFQFNKENSSFTIKDGLSEEETKTVKKILKTINYLPFENLEDIAIHIRDFDKKFTLLYAFNGVGKTRLSVAFKNEGKKNPEPDTLYYNAFTEDLFFWENDLDNDLERHLNINLKSDFFKGLPGLDITNKVRDVVRKYADFNFDIDFDEGKVYFEREIIEDGQSTIEKNIKVSRGEENIFIWSFFSAVAQLVIDGEERYNWVKYIYIDDPISSLDDNNAIAVGHYLAKMLKVEQSTVKTIISTHHSLFYNVLCNEFKNSNKLLLRKKGDFYDLKNTTDTPFIYHVSIIKDIQRAIDEDKLVNFHFTILRNLLEKSANFHGFDGFENLIVLNDDDEYKTLHTRFVQVFNHGGYSLFEPAPMGDDNKARFIEIFDNFKKNYKFNDELFTNNEAEITT